MIRPEIWIANIAFKVAMATLGRRDFTKLMRLAENPVASQTRALQKVLKAVCATEQGAALALTTTCTVDQFRKQTPIHDYNQIQPYIARQIETGAPAIAPRRPLMYARSSGTTGEPKYIPVTWTALRQMITAQRIMAYVQHRAINAFAGDLVGFGGAMREETLSDGSAAGAATGLIYRTMPPVVQAKYVLPAFLFGIEDYDLKYRIAARLALQDGAITMMGCANPSTLLRFMDIVREDLPGMAREVETGKCSLLSGLPLLTASMLRLRLRPNPGRGRMLSDLAASGEAITIGALWPDLRCVCTWLGGGCAIAAGKVSAQLPAAAIMVDAGYVASEVRGTVVVDVARRLALPMLGDVFFEFAPVDAWEGGARETLLLHEIEQGKEYYIIVTTASGLLRYNMNDVVRVSGIVGATPTFTFVRKGRGVTNIGGEKISEDQIHLAIGALSSPPRFYVVLADTPGAVYRAYIEADDKADAIAMANALDESLKRLNIEYAAKRASGRIAPLAVCLLRDGTGDAYHRHCVVGKGQREAQIKVLALQTTDECDFDFKAFVLQ